MVTYDVKFGMYCKLNKYMKIRMSLRPRSYLTWAKGHLDFVLVYAYVLKHLLLRNHWAYQSQIPCRYSLEWGNKLLFKLTLSHDQDAHIWLKPLKGFFFGTYWQSMADVVETWYTASGTRVLPSSFKWWPWVDIWPFYAKVNVGSICICLRQLLYGF